MGYDRQVLGLGKTQFECLHRTTLGGFLRHLNPDRHTLPTPKPIGMHYQIWTCSQGLWHGRTALIFSCRWRRYHGLNMPPPHSSGKPLMMYLEEALERRWEQWESGFPWWVNMKFSGLNLIQICENSRARCSFHLCAALAFPPGADFFLPWRPYWTESVFPRQGSVWIYDLICVFGTKKLFLGWSLKKWLKTIISSPQPSLEGGKRLEVREVEWGVSWDGHMLESCLSPGIQGKKDKVGIPFEA